MIQLNNPPSLDELQTLSAKVPYFPISSHQLVKFASSIDAPKNVIDFYKAFPHDEMFISHDDLWTRSEQIELMEEQDEPFEIVLSHEG